MSFIEFFKSATSNTPPSRPYEYQSRLAGNDAGAECRSQLINIPTGLGKTAAVVLAWLWNRAHLENSKWPRRLVYCLPMRTLVEQTRDEANKWIAALQKENLLHDKPPKVIIVMGGEELKGEAKDWDLYPEENAIIIGTQDMLLSRALNRGYGMSRYRWPMHFGLLNNDCLWVMDETQLIGVGVETSAQLDGFRHDGRMQTFGVCPTWWMSATLDETRLATVDHPKPVDGWPTERLSDAEETGGQPHKLITAPKAVSSAPHALNSTTKGSYAKQLAALIKNKHQPGTLTLVVVNRVSRARQVFEALTGGKPLYAPEKVALIHSRFRPIDRERHTRLLFSNGDRIVIATQAVEAGVDISARLLVTELSPWPSLVQRIGRCNRQAKIPDAEVLWVDIQPKDEKDDLVLPYSKEELDQARAAIASLTNASPRALREVEVQQNEVIRPVIRRRDLVDLFDTTPDICGRDLDISRYIRDGKDNDVQFFWRDIAGDAPHKEEPQPQRIELCRVSIGEAAKFLKNDKVDAWLWNPLEKKWDAAARSLRPGGVYLVRAASGGYEDDLGWTGEIKVKKLTTHRPPDKEQDSHDDDPGTYTRSWQPLAEHTWFVVQETESLTNSLRMETAFAEALRTGALWHDLGKAHDVFQKMLCNGDAARAGQLWAKSDHRTGRCKRRGFRHELASAIAWLLKGPADAAERDLIAYVINAHHGKVRLSIRSLPDETGDPKNPDGIFARGIWHGDTLPAVNLGELMTPEISLDLSFMKMGEGQHGSSWLARTVALRDRLGPFRLAFLETILRAADARASRKMTT